MTLASQSSPVVQEMRLIRSSPATTLGAALVVLLALMVMAAVLAPHLVDYDPETMDFNAVLAGPSIVPIRSAPTISAATC